MTYDFWNEQGYKELAPMERELLAALEQTLEGAPKGTLPYLLRHMHKALEDRARAEAKGITLKLDGMPPEMQAIFMAQAYPEILETAQAEGFEEVGQFLAFQAMMGCARPVCPEEEAHEDREERETNP